MPGHRGPLGPLHGGLRRGRNLEEPRREVPCAAGLLRLRGAAAGTARTRRAQSLGRRSGLVLGALGRA
eukprot:15455486-Alexandrium_andersonii.AAC.1